MSKLEIIPGYEVLERINKGIMQPGDQYRRLNPKYPISLFVVGEEGQEEEELRPSTKSFMEDKFIVLKIDYASLSLAEKEAVATKVEQEVKEEALRIAATLISKEDMKEEIYQSTDCPSNYGLMNWCGQSCRNCIKQAIDECTITFVND